MATPIEDPTGQNALPPPDGGPVGPSPLTREQIDDAFPVDSRTIAFARARAASSAAEGANFYEVVAGLPPKMQQALIEARHAGISHFLRSWAESIAEQAKLDREAALKALKTATELASAQRNRENLGPDARAELETVLESLRALETPLAEGQPLVLNTHAPAPFFAEASPADLRNGLPPPSGGVRIGPRQA